MFGKRVGSWSFMLVMALSGCAPDNTRLVELCKVAFEGTKTLKRSKFDKADVPLVTEGGGVLTVEFFYTETNVHNTPTAAGCEFAAASAGSSAPELLRMGVNGNMYSEDKLILGQLAIFDWLEKQWRTGVRMPVSGPNAELTRLAYPVLAAQSGGHNGEHRQLQ